MHHAFQVAIQERSIVTVPENKSWIALPSAFNPDGTLDQQASTIFQRQKQIHQDWADAMTSVGGLHFERLFRRDIPNQAIWLNQGGLNLTDHTQKINIDAFSPSHNLTIELKNQLSDVFHAPTLTSSKHWTKDIRKIDRVFKWARRFGFTPVLVAPFIDATFYGYQSTYNGFSMSTLFQILPPQYANLVSDIKQVFRFSQIIASEQLPSHIARRFRELAQDFSVRKH